MLSSAEALAQFMYNPSPYLLEPNPRVPCKLCVLGTLASGKTSLTKSLAEHFNAVVSITIKTGFTALKPEVNTAISDDGIANFCAAVCDFRSQCYARKKMWTMQSL